jgi:hypothetical protein
MVDYYHILNEDRDKARFKLWEKTRDFNTAFIKFAIKKCQINIDKMLIIGAGNCDDIDLTKFQEKKLYYLDIDVKSVKKGIKRQNVKYYKDNIIFYDLTGFTYIDLYDKIMTCNTFLEAENLIYAAVTERMFKTTLQANINNIETRFNIVIFLPVFTQLFNHLLATMKFKFPNNNQNEMSDLLKRLSIVVTENINELLKEICNKQTLIIGITDIFEITAFGKDFLIQFINDYIECINNHDYMKLRSKYHDKSLIGVNIYDSLFLGNMLRNTIIDNYLWHYASNRGYYMFYTAGTR